MSAVVARGKVAVGEGLVGVGLGDSILSTDGKRGKEDTEDILRIGRKGARRGARTEGAATEHHKGPGKEADARFL